MVSVAAPEPPAIDAGLKPPLVMPVGKPDSLPTARLTVPANPDFGVTVTVNVVDCPGNTARADGVTSLSKSALCGSTVIVRVGGLGSELRAASTTVSEVTNSPGTGKVTLPGVCAVEVAGEPLGKIHPYFVATVLVPKKTEPPAVIVVSEAGEVIAPSGGAVAYGESWRNRAVD